VNPVRPQGQPGQPQAVSTLVNQQQLASCIAIANQEEVSIAQFASSKTKNDEVKEFAKMLVDEHQAFLKKLQRFTPEAANASLAQSPADDNRNESAAAKSGQIQLTAGQADPRDPAQPQQPAQPQPAQPGRQGQPLTGQSAGGVDMLQLHREIAQQCLTDTKKKLSEEDASKFDHCFIGHQIASHAAMKTKLTVIRRHATGEFAQVLDEGIEATEKHMKKAEKIMQDLADHKPGARRNRDSDSN
jgi:predicted outer membrane protein